MSEVLDEQTALEFLEAADMEILGLLPYASNATLLVRLTSGDREGLAVYKPRRGERPLWDFPDGTLCERETAAFVVSRALGWSIVPPTILREGPAGYGALQWFIEEDEEVDVRQLAHTHPDELARLVLFDVLINNADRKAGHLLVDKAGKLWGIDHGVSFNEDPKLRTVVWVHEGAPVPKPLLDDLAAFARDGCASLDDLLTTHEIGALHARAGEILETKRFPEPDPYGRNVPWPPW